MDAVYMEAIQAHDRSGRLADDGRSSPRRPSRSTPARTSHPGRRTACRRSVRSSTAVASLWLDRRGEVGPSRAGDHRAAGRRTSRCLGTEPPTAGAARPGGAGARPASSTRRTAGSAARRSSRRRWCSSSCCATTPAPARRRRCAMVAAPASAWPAAGSTTSSAAGSPATASTRAWVVPHFEKMLYDNALLLRVYAHWWRATGHRWPSGSCARPPSSCCATCAPPTVGSPRRSTRTRCSTAGPPRARPTSGPRAAARGRSATTTAHGPPRCWASPTAALSRTARRRPQFPEGSRMTRSRCGSARRRPALGAGDAAPAGPGRQGRHGVERPGHRRAGGRGSPARGAVLD